MKNQKRSKAKKLDNRRMCCFTVGKDCKLLILCTSNDILDLLNLFVCLNNVVVCIVELLLCESQFFVVFSVYQFALLTV